MNDRRGTGKKAVAIIILAIAVASVAAYSFFRLGTADTKTGTSTETSTLHSLPSYPPGTRFVRIRALESNSAWPLKNLTAQQVLNVISDIKPDALERYVSGPQNPSATVPVAPGSPPMTVGEFLNASMSACKCYIIPRLSLGSYDSGRLLTQSANLLTLPVYPMMRYLSLDNWKPFAASHSSDEIKGMFQKLYAQGWAGIGLNECDGYSPSYGYATFADFCVSTNTWEPNIIQLTGLKAESNIGLRLLYIDFPQAMANFSALSPTQEADILAHNLAPVQSKDGFLFVYPIVQGIWDSTTRFTPSGSAYGGKSIYEVMKGLMGQYNNP